MPRSVVGVVVRRRKAVSRACVCVCVFGQESRASPAGIRRRGTGRGRVDVEPNGNFGFEICSVSGANEGLGRKLLRAKRTVWPASGDWLDPAPGPDDERKIQPRHSRCCCCCRCSPLTFGPWVSRRPRPAVQRMSAHRAAPCSVLPCCCWLSLPLTECGSARQRPH